MHGIIIDKCVHLQTALPLSAAVFLRSKSFISTCPPRLDVQILSPSTWCRIPNSSIKTSVMKLSNIRGWSMICDDPGTMICDDPGTMLCDVNFFLSLSNKFTIFQ